MAARVRSDRPILDVGWGCTLSGDVDFRDTTSYITDEMSVCQTAERTAEELERLLRRLEERLLRRARRLDLKGKH